jgi:hypothetical protein
MNSFMLPIVVAYGVRPDLTLMVRQPLHHREMSMAGSSTRKTGVGDLFVLGKYKVFRRNTRQYTFGVSTTLGLEAPTGDVSFTSETWDVNLGLYSSWRSGPWGSDVNVSYSWNGLVGPDGSDVDAGDELSVDWALAYQFSLGDEASVSLTPLLESSYRNVLPDRLHDHDVSNSGESVLYLSPGIKYTVSSFILEALLQIPVWEQREGSQLERGTGAIAGVRYMF